MPCLPDDLAMRRLGCIAWSMHLYGIGGLCCLVSLSGPQDRHKGGDSSGVAFASTDFECIVEV
jgi:hypothetical protein